MYINYAKAIFEKLITNEFLLFSDNTSLELSEDTNFIPLIKNVGNVLYVIYIINDNISTEIYKQFFLSKKNSFNSDTIIFMSLYLTNSTESILEQIPRSQFITGLDFYSINWIVDKKSNKLVIPDGETESLLNLDNLIRLALDNVSNEDCEAVNLFDLQVHVNKKTSLKVKSNSSAFTFGLIFINFIVLLIIELLVGFGASQNEEVLLLFGANNYTRVVRNHEFYRLITSMFLHIGFIHFAVNSLSLYIYGSRIEKYYGKSSFIIIYVLSGIVASGVSVMATGITSAGSSGAIFGLLGALISLIFKTKKSVDGLSLYVIIMLTISSVGFGFLVPSVDNHAHIGGLIAGIIIGWFCLEPVSNCM